MTHASPRRVLASLVLCGGIALAHAGCDGMEAEATKADKRVSDAVKKVLDDKRAPTTQSLTAALGELNKAAGETTASATSRIRAKALQAQHEFAIGKRLAADTSKFSPEVSRLLWQISQSASQIDQFNKYLASAAQAEPKTPLAAIAERRTAQEGLASAAAAEAAKLQGEIDKVKGQISTMQQEKDKLIASADQDTDASRKVQGKEASDLLDKAAESRRKAGNIGHEVDKLTQSLFPLERDLAQEQSKKATADGAIAALDNEKKTIETNWQAQQTQMAEQTKLRQQAFDRLTAAATELDAVAKQAADVRGQAAKQLESAAKHYESASADASGLSKDIAGWKRLDQYANAVERKTWDRLGEVYNLNVFKLHEAESDHALAELHSEHLANLDARGKVAAAIAAPLQAAGLTAPATLAADTEKQAAADASGKLFTAAAEKFLSVYQGSGGSAALKDVVQAAKISRMFSLYGQYLNGDQTKLQAARDEYKAAFEGDVNNAIVRLLPADLKA